MGQVINKTNIERHVITKDGELEVTITLNLNINLNQDGSVTIANEKVEKVEKVEKKDKLKLEIPDFETPDELIDFG